MYRFIAQIKIARDRDPPKQKKEAGDKKAPDHSWRPPTEEFKFD